LGPHFGGSGGHFGGPVILGVQLANWGGPGVNSGVSRGSGDNFWQSGGHFRWPNDLGARLRVPVPDLSGRFLDRVPGVISGGVPEVWVQFLSIRGYSLMAKRLRASIASSCPRCVGPFLNRGGASSYGAEGPGQLPRSGGPDRIESPIDIWRIAKAVSIDCNWIDFDGQTTCKLSIF